MSRLDWPINRLLTGSWSSPLTSRLLLEVRFAARRETYDYPDTQLDGTRNFQLVQVTEQSTGLTYRSMGGIANGNRPFQQTASKIGQAGASLSYVTGAHAFKFGFTDVWVQRESDGGSRQPFPYSYRSNNGVPTLLTDFAIRITTSRDSAVDSFAWTSGRSTTHAQHRRPMRLLQLAFPRPFMGRGAHAGRNITFPKTEG